MTNYFIKTLTINFEEIPFTIKLVAPLKDEAETAIHAITLKAKLNSYLTTNNNLYHVVLIKNIFEKFLRPLLNQNVLVAAAINGGGNIQAGVAKNCYYIWNIAIENPNNSQNNIYTYHFKNGAVATENLSIDDLDIHPPLLKQVTIASSNLITADRLAKTAISMGEKQFSKLSEQQNIHGVLINQKDTITVLE